MRKTHFLKKIFFLFVLFMLTIIGCKKEPDKNDNSHCSATTFQTTIEEAGSTAIDITEDSESNTILLYKNPEGASITKLDKEGTVLWTKSIANKNQPKEIFALLDNSFVVLYKGETQIEHLTATYDNIWVQIGLNDPEMGCAPIYELGTDEGFTIKGALEIERFDAEGNLQWSKKTEAVLAGNNSFLDNSDHSFLLLAAEPYGKQPDYLYDNNGIVDTVNFPFDSNKVLLYKIAYSGETIWKNEVDHVFNYGFSETFNPEIDFIRVENNILIKTIKRMIMLDSDGKELSRTDLFPGHCDNELFGMTSVGTNTYTYLVNGSYSIYDDLEHPVDYTLCYNLDGSLKWQTDHVIQLEDGGKTCFVSVGYRKITCYNLNGEEKWLKEDVNYEGCLIINCNDGVTYTGYDESNQIVVTRTDNDGNI